MITQGGLPSFSPNGKSLACIGNGSVFVAAATNGFVTSATHPVWSHDGKTLYYLAINQAVSVQSSVYQLYSVPAAGGLVTASLGGTTIDVIVPAGATGDPVACAWTF
ncbi:MAG: hypothetical protein JWP17_1570 [Solirubrobacterales bacterium]|nr:hypothetical protein [Solirubrobacterales bacterium]